MMDEEKRGRCLECGDVLPYGRSDMKFCSVSCKSRYHYQSSGQARNTRLRAISALDRNHEILDRILSEGFRSVEIAEMMRLGFRFDLMTSYSKVKGHNEYRCYDIRYFMSSTRVFGIERCVRKI